MASYVETLDLAFAPAWRNKRRRKRPKIGPTWQNLVSGKFLKLPLFDGCGRNVLSKSWEEAKQLIYGDSCLDSVLSSVRRNVVVVGGVALLLSIGLLLAVATTRDYMNALRRRPKLAPDDGCQSYDQ
ncbi:hypothetical protein MTO96_048641 [Rhipicephalus appendiculatus]